jgi:uncharacterized membrane protein
MSRIRSIDTTRGLVMVIMVLDHVRDFMHTSSISQDPTNLATTTPVLFLTRWVTHLCAPTFVFLSGVSAYLSFKRNNNITKSRKYLIIRGIWLLILEFTVINFALWFDIHFRLELMEVISAIGLSFIVLSFLLKLPSRLIGAIGLFIIFSHNILQIVNPEGSVVRVIFSVFFRPGMIQIAPDTGFFTAYPLAPWLGIMLTGFACGELFELPEEKRKRVFLRTGIFALLLFGLIRFINFYGDPSRWAEQKNILFTILSFVNVTKYPPSLLFSLLFLGIMFLFLFLSEKKKNQITEVLSVYGRVPLFFFVLHLYLIHTLMFVMLYLQGFKAGDMLFGPFMNGRPKTGGGVDLFVIYILWVSVAALLYPFCKWYGNYKISHPGNRLLRYL